MPNLPSPPQSSPGSANRVLSIDVFRGLTMLVMIFVNDLAGVKGLPWWTYHMPRGVNGMTYVDVVFPAFLFIVGMSIPLSVEKRLRDNGSPLRLWGHILLRFAGLAVLGIFIANWSKLDPELAGVSKRLWSLTGFAGAILLWNVYPRSRYSIILKCAGFFLLFSMLAIFRRTANGQTAWLDFSYWEILGLIARAYLAVCILYVPLRRWRWSPALLLVALCALNVASRLGFHSPFGRGDLPSITMAGIVASQIFLDPYFAPHRFRWASAYAALLFAAGWLLKGFGVAKLGATPTWCLWCSAISVVLFLALYWLVDVRHYSAWAAFLKPAGANTLLTYLLPDIYYAAFGSFFLRSVTGSVLFTAFMLAAAAVMTRWRVRMQL